MHLFEVITEKTNVIMAYEFNFTGINFMDSKSALNRPKHFKLTRVQHLYVLWTEFCTTKTLQSSNLYLMLKFAV